MATVIDAPPALTPTMADVLRKLGNIPPERVLAVPAPGTAKLQDVVDCERLHHRLCELVDGVLVEKPMGFRESLLASFLIRVLQDFVHPRNLGLVTAPDGMMEVLSGLVRMPDVAFISWDRFPNRKIPTVADPRVAPDLVIEILSPSNTSEEMNRKRREYFEAGVQLVWIIDPDTRTASVYTGPDKFKTLTKNETLMGEPVLPGFTLKLETLFSELDRQPNQ